MKNYTIRKMRFKNKIGRLTTPNNILIVLSLVTLILTVVIPLIMLAQSTFTLASADSRRAKGVEGQVSLYYWKYIFASHMSKSVLWNPLMNSLMIAFFSCLISVPLGTGLAWFMVRSDIKYKKTLSFLIVVPYMIPSWCKSMAWLSVFRNERSGSLGLLSGMGLNIPDWLAYGPFAVICVLSLHYYAYSYILVSGALLTVNSELEEMGEIQGAGKPRILRKITFPLVLPSILSALIMTATKAIGTYASTSTLVNIIGYPTLATRMYSMLGTGVKGNGYVLALLMVGLSAGFVLLNQLLVNGRKSFETIGGKGSRKRFVSIGKYRTLISILLLVFLFIVLVLPILFLFAETFLKIPGAGYGKENLTFYYWIGRLEEGGLSNVYPGLFRNSSFLNALWNTVRLSLLTAVITALFGQIFGYITARNRNKWYGKTIEQLVFIPYIIPSVAFGAIYLALFTRSYAGLPSLYGTFFLLGLVCTVKHFPFASRAGFSNMIQISESLEDAAAVEGCGFVRKMIRIMIPLSKNGFVSGFLLVFVSVSKELDLISILMTTKTRTLSALAFLYKDNAMPQAAAAIALVMVVFIMSVYWISSKIFHTDISKSV